MENIEKTKTKNVAYIEKLKNMSHEDLCKELSKKLKKDFYCKPEQVCRDNYVAKNTSHKVCPYVVVLGYVNAAASQLQSLGDLEFVGIGDFGDGLDNQGLILTNSEIKDLGKVKRIYGSLMLDGVTKYVQSLGEVEYIGGHCYLNRTPVKNMGKVKEIGGILSLDNSRVTTLEGLKKAGKIYGHLAYSLQDWGSTLKEVGDVEFTFTPLTQKKTNNNDRLYIHDKFYDIFKRNSSGNFERIEIKKEETIEM